MIVSVHVPPMHVYIHLSSSNTTYLWFMNYVIVNEIFGCVGDVRGEGMFLGIDLVKNRETREPATAEAAFINKT